MLIQAGQSGRGQAFAAKWAELVFVIYHTLEDGEAEYDGSSRPSRRMGATQTASMLHPPAMSVLVKRSRWHKRNAP